MAADQICCTFFGPDQILVPVTIAVGVIGYRIELLGQNHCLYKEWRVLKPNVGWKKHFIFY